MASCLYVLQRKLVFSRVLPRLARKLRTGLLYLRRRRLEIFPVWRHFTVPGALMYDESQYVVDRIDEVSRILFPGAFLLTSLTYWTYYIYIAED